MHESVIAEGLLRRKRRAIMAYAYDFAYHVVVVVCAELFLHYAWPVILDWWAVASPLIH